MGDFTAPDLAHEFIIGRAHSTVGNILLCFCPAAYDELYALVFQELKPTGAYIFPVGNKCHAFKVEMLHRFEH